MAGDGGGAAGDGLDTENGLRGVVERDGIFGGFDSRLEEGVVEIGEDVDGLAFFVGLVCESVWDAVVVVLLGVSGHVMGWV